MKKITMIILISPLILIISCKEKSPDSCGDSVSQSFGWETNYQVPPWVDATFTTFMEEGHRIFQVETPVYGNVCPGEPIYAFTSCKIYKPYPEGSSIWVVFKYRYGDMMDKGNSDYNFNPEGTYTNFDFSIQDAYPTEAGAFYFIIQWKMISPSSDPDDDLTYFQAAFHSTLLNFSYKKY